MYKFITKKFISDALKSIKIPFVYKIKGIRLKTWQDLSIIYYFKDIKNKTILEVGGGFSRVFKNLNRSNKLYNLDKFDGLGNGPKSFQKVLFKLLNPRVNLLNYYLGSQEIPKKYIGYFDFIYSISVIEHIKIGELTQFFDESIDLMCTGGVSYHCIDFYLSNSAEDELLNENIDRFNFIYKYLIDNPNISFLNKEEVYNDIQFKTDYITNSDEVVFLWNKQIPEISQTRLIAQNVSLIVAFKKI